MIDQPTNIYWLQRVHDEPKNIAIKFSPPFIWSLYHIQGVQKFHFKQESNVLYDFFIFSAFFKFPKMSLIMFFKMKYFFLDFFVSLHILLNKGLFKSDVSNFWTFSDYCQRIPVITIGVYQTNRILTMKIYYF